MLHPAHLLWTRSAGDIGNVPLAAVDTALSAMNEDELRMLEYKTEQSSKVDLIADTWPLWYSIYVRCCFTLAANRANSIPVTPKTSHGCELK